MDKIQNSPLFIWFSLVLLLTICVVQAKIELRKYTKLGSGQNIMGTILAEFTSRSKLKCSDRSKQYF